ncbi:zinc finger protein ZPR1-like protein [Cucumis melo var. makuwa]|uniref:Zinc finger protein ZPR1-like protein n=1 Tax=Cucumis melo var. makuwa TaxID=1194695 RepID=A0A5D3BU53_CUCMM|nr:zinc finger protein ZPR1-like protein [Cucumis melo var. makuwa]
MSSSSNVWENVDMSLNIGSPSSVLNDHYKKSSSVNHRTETNERVKKGRDEPLPPCPVAIVYRRALKGGGSQPLSRDEICDQVLGKRPDFSKGIGWRPKLKAHKTTSASSSTMSCSQSAIERDSNTS